MFGEIQITLSKYVCVEKSKCLFEEIVGLVLLGKMHMPILSVCLKLLIIAVS